MKVSLESSSPTGAAAGEALAAHDEAPLLVIKPTSGWAVLNVAELWRYRGLLGFLVWRDLKVRYKQTLLGVTWAVLQPSGLMLVFSAFLHRLAALESGAVPYPLFVFCGIMPWLFFANAITAAGGSLVANQELVTKVYFPRLIVPVAATVAVLIDFAVAMGMLAIMMVYYGWQLSWTLLLVPFVVALLLLTAVGVGLLLAALMVAYRDVKHTLGYLVQFWMFATPTIYMHERAHLNPRWSMVLPLNPVDGLITNFRVLVLGLPYTAETGYALALSSLIGVLLLLAGCFYFKRVERSFADVI